MDEWVKLTEYNWAYWIAGLFALIEFAKWFIKAITTFNEWLFKKVGIKTKKMLKREADERRLKDTELAIKEIKETSTKNVEMFLQHERETLDKIGLFAREIVVKIDSLENKQSEINNTVAEVKHEFEQKNADDWRWDILDFFNSSINNRKHYKEEWEHVINQLKKYENYVSTHNIDNGVFEEASTWLRNEYRKHLKANDFLQPDNNYDDR